MLGDPRIEGRLQQRNVNVFKVYETILLNGAGDEMLT